MDVIIWLILTILSVFFTLLMVFLEDYDRIYGFGLVISIVATFGWIVAGLSAIDLTDTTAGYNASSAAMELFVVHYDSSWLITIFYLLLSIFPFLMILKKIPETWKMEKKE
jgi:hypothetical protein